jgi:hypothetical protein
MWVETDFFKKNFIPFEHPALRGLAAALESPGINSTSKKDLAA